VRVLGTGLLKVFSPSGRLEFFRGLSKKEGAVSGRLEI